MLGASFEQPFLSQTCCTEAVAASLPLQCPGMLVFSVQPRGTLSAVAFLLLLIPLAVAAQTLPPLYVHPHLYSLRPSARFYRSLSDTVTALPVKLDSTQVVAATLTYEQGWAYVQNILGTSTSGEWQLISPADGPFSGCFVRRADLVLVPAKLPPRRKKRKG